MRRLYSRTAIAAAVLLSVAVVRGEVIDFSETASPFGFKGWYSLYGLSGSYEENGFRVSCNENLQTFFIGGSYAPDLLTHPNPTGCYLFQQNSSFITTIETVSGNPFMLRSFRAGLTFPSVPGGLDITGTLADGTTVSTSVPVEVVTTTGNVMPLYELDPTVWIDLISVTFVQQFPANFYGFDDFEVYEIAQPEVSCDLQQDTLWSPDHQLREVGLTIDVTDPADPDPAVGILVFANETDHDQSTNDVDIDAEGNVRLRAERNGNGTGRVYLIVVIAENVFGREGFDCCTVAVPHDQSDEALDAVDGAAITAERECLLQGAAPAGYSLIGSTAASP